MAPQQQKSRRYYIKTYGCQMNEYDSAKLAEILEAAGYQEVLREEAADLILVNTCVVRQHAEDRASGYIKSLSGLKRKNPDLKIGLCGCLASQPGRDLKKMFPHVDWFIPPNGTQRLSEYLNLSFDIGHWSLGRRRNGGVVVMHGCDNFCSYCIVPYVRGRETSRPVDEVLAEIEKLIKQGTRRITLLGQNVNSYRYGLADLLRKIGSLISQSPNDLVPRSPDIHISFLTSHPKDLSDDLINAVAELPYVEKEFVLPLQSGDDRILEKMNRKYTLEHYLGLVRKIRSLMPHARLVSDILVGFPGETEEQFQNTLQAVKDIRFSEVHMFAYSDRPPAAASCLPDKIPRETIERRLQQLITTVREVVRA